MYYMSAINLSYIKPKNTLSVASHKSDLVSAIVDKVKQIENYAGLKNDAELIVFVCSCIENALIHKSISKKDLCLEVFDKLFNMSAADNAILSSSIDFLCNNGLVQTIPVLKKYSAIVSHYIKSKL